ncbi:anaerobic glycerol-3-phosphate dehydrogenase subunit A [Desulforegula conservatrix]|uniref:anaerobic glycerol-3-phosphate dehydrogenase subunit A n=1 Tax=Desulforegula conservatrix TaxID=153026 RepID=UPI00041FA06A|nr:anaerobic glycerol-3-phosphate dehydrogenase subunit A [Desulforegula conservatrix]
MVRGHTRIVIIGCGVTGAGIARDLSLRGVECVVLDASDSASGASGSNHGLLHSGARYAVKDPKAAEECSLESEILKKIAPHCIEDTGGLFVGLPGDDEKYFSDFEESCSKENIEFRALDTAYALELEPSLSKKIITAYALSDATVDPFRLTLENLEDAKVHGCTFLPYSKVVGFGIHKGRIEKVRFRNLIAGDESEITADYIINATGAWAAKVTDLAGIYIPVRCSKGTLIVSASRITGSVVNRLRSPSDGDIIVPGGTVSIIGTSSSIIENPDSAFPQPSETDYLIEEASLMVPQFSDTRFIRAYSGVRPLFDTGDNKEHRCISRGYVLRDHSGDGIDNFATISGGKLTTYRLMAEKTVDLVCSKLGIDAVCQTATKMLPDSRKTSWSIPCASAKHYFLSAKNGGRLLCECEMISEHIVDEIVDDLLSQGREPTLNEIALRSRVGKGPCQGCGCSSRIAAYLHERGIYKGRDGIRQIKSMTQSRWKGLRPVICGDAAAQLELQESVQMGIFGIERQ